MGRNEVIWVDRESNFMDVSQDANEEVAAVGAVLAQTSAAQLAQQLARQAGVDFRSVDSLRIAWLSVLLVDGAIAAVVHSLQEAYQAVARGGRCLLAPSIQSWRCSSSGCGAT